MTLTELNNLYAADSFMKPVIYYGRFFEVETSHGTEFVDQDLIGKTLHPTNKQLEPFIEGFDLEFVQVVDGWGFYLSTAGYMDKTELSVCDTQQQAIDSLEALI